MTTTDKSPADALTRKSIEAIARKYAGAYFSGLLFQDADSFARFSDELILAASPVEQPAAAPADKRAAITTDGYFVYDPAGSHVEFYDTDAERDAAHRDAINEYRREAMHDQEWSTEVVGIVSGIVTHTTAELKVDEDSYDYEPGAARASSANMTEDQRTAVEFYAANPSAALLDFAARVSRNCGSSANETAAEGAKAIAYRVLRRNTVSGEWVSDGRHWNDGAPTAALLAETAARSDEWRVEIAYASAQAAEPVAQWQYRVLTPGYEGDWHNCNAETAQRLQQPDLADFHKVRPLYAASLPPALADVRGGMTGALRQAREELSLVEWENDPPARVTKLFSTIDALLITDPGRHAGGSRANR